MPKIIGDRIFTTADCVGTAPVEGYNIESQKGRFRLNANSNLTDFVRESILDLPDWLPVAAEVYDISPNLKDYVLVPVVSMPSDLPNRNGAAFPLSLLASFNPEAGMISYKTWVGKPTHVEHQSDNMREAKGIILGTAMFPLKGVQGDLWKLVKLSAWDRNKDSALVNGILNKTKASYSMGALSSDYACSICGHSYIEGLKKGFCDHVTDVDPMKIVGERLAYWNVAGIMQGIELSNVGTPAFTSAVNEDFIEY